MYAIRSYYAVVPLPDILQQAVESVRARRLRAFLGKVGRECTQFSVERGMRRFSVIERSQGEALRHFLASPDQVVAAGKPLKTGESSTVVDVIDSVITSYSIHYTKLYESRSEQRVDEGGDGRALRQHEQSAEQQEDDDDRRQP